jgi:hypothetical protein
VVAGDRLVPAGEEPHEPPPARVRPAGGKHARAEAEAEAADQADDGTSTDAEPTEDETEPLPAGPLPSGPSRGPDADGWLPFAASDEPASDRDRTAGLTAMILAAAVVAVCGVGGLLTILTGSDGEVAPATVAAARTSAPAAASPSPTPSRAPAAVAPAASTTDKPTATAPRATTPPRATGTHATARPAASRPVRNRDGEPLTIQEVFGSDRVIVQGREYRLAYTDGTTDCAAGARGTTAAELRRSGCTQLIRAVAVDGSGRHAVTVGVANLPDAAAAGRVVATEHGRGGFAAMWSRRGRGAGGADGYRETGAVGRFVVYGIAASSERGRADRGGADRAAMQAVADLRAVVAARLRTHG